MIIQSVCFKQEIESSSLLFPFIVVWFSNGESTNFLDPNVRYIQQFFFHNHNISNV